MLKTSMMMNFLGQDEKEDGWGMFGQVKSFRTVDLADQVLKWKIQICIVSKNEGNLSGEV